MSNKTLNIIKKISFTDKFTLIFSFIANFFVHIFAYTNPLFVYDSAHIFDNSTGIDNGRLLVGVFMNIFEGIQSPWLSGVLFSVLIALTINTIRYILQINKIPNIIILSLLVISFPVIFYTHNFIGSIAVYAFSLFAATLSVAFIKKGGKINYFISVICVILSLMSYQAYLSFAVALFLIYTVTDFIKHDSISKFIKTFLIGAGIFIVATIIYYGIWKLVLTGSTIEASSYRGEGDITVTGFKEMLLRIIPAYICGLQITLSNIYTNNFSTFNYVLMQLLNAGSIILFFFIKRKTKNPLPAFLSAIVLAGIPLATGLLYIFSPFKPHVLMIFSLISCPLLLLFDLEHINFKKAGFIKKVFSVIFIIIIAENIILGNAGYIKNYSDIQRSLSLSTRIVDRVEQTEGVTKDTPIILVADTAWYVIDEDSVEYKISTPSKITGFHDTRTWKKNLSQFSVTVGINATPYLDSLIWYINDNCNYMGLDYSYKLTNDEIFKNSSIIDDLEKFPAKNCTAWLNDSLIVYI